MSDKTMPTPYPWYATAYPDDPNADGSWDILYSAPEHGGMIAWVPDESDRAAADARLIAAAGTAAHEVAQMGYDPVEAVRALPKLLRMAQSIRDARAGHEDRYAREVLRQHDDDAKAALARAAGKESDDDQ